MKIGLIGAMETEVSFLRSKMEAVTEEKVGQAVLWTGKLYGKDAVLSQCGIGKIHAAMCAQAMILKEKPDCLINIGVAGALDEKLDIGDIVVGDFAVQHDLDTTMFGDPLGMVQGINMVKIPCDEKIRRAMEKAAEKEKLHFITAGIATGDQFISDLEKKKGLKNTFDCAACDMEGAAISQVCFEMGVPYGAYRAISDTLTGSEKEYMENVKTAADSSQKLLREFLSCL